MKLTTNQRRVLSNLASKQPMWSGIAEINPGGGQPAIATSLKKRGLISLDRRGKYEITAHGLTIINTK